MRTLFVAATLFISQIAFANNCCLRQQDCDRQALVDRIVRLHAFSLKGTTVLFTHMPKKKAHR